MTVSVPPSDGLLLVGHGSRSVVSESEMHGLANLVADALPEVMVRLGFLEMSEPPAGPVLDQLVADGCERVVVLPLVLLAAGHGKSDVPAIVLEGRQRHPEIDLRFGNPLGITRDLISILGDAVLKSGADGAPFLLIARGTSDPDANGDAHKIARLIGEWTGAPFVHTAFTGVTNPRVPDALELLHKLDFPKVVTGFWFLADGVLMDRARDDIEAFTAATGVEVTDVGHLGPDPRLVPTVIERYRQALGDVSTVNCDTCSYRAAWPGIEARVGEAVGIGHSHLAAEHRHHGADAALHRPHSH